MQFQINHATNGCILSTRNEETGETESTVFQAHGGDEERATVDAFADFLRAILDQYGPQSSRYSEHRIYIRVESGDKWEPPPEKNPKAVA